MSDWKRAEQALLGLPEHSWSRGDIAADFFRGEVTNERVRRAHAEGKFMYGGRGPALRQIISSDGDDGETLYVGKRGGDKLGRFYEKGKKEFGEKKNRLMRRLADSPSGMTVTDSSINGGESFDLGSWYRAELELRAKNRPIPEDWISRRDEYFAGAYPFLQEILPEAEGRIIVRPRDMGIISIEGAFDNIRRQWGSALYTGLAYCGGDHLALFEKIIGVKHSRRLIEAGALLAIADDQL
ncbi:MAG: replication initiation factor domain-containing protein [Burkholderiales bacterium]|nr:replication initiation factor domain-containing protein [Burkholderiales bacterium]